MFSITANDLVTGNINLVIANRSSSDKTSKGQSASKTLSSSICFGKVALCEEANLNPRIEGKKWKDSEEEFVFIPAAGISLDT